MALVAVSGPSLAELEFTQVPHAYYWRGKELPSVTHVMRTLGLGFVGFAPEEALQRGTYVHEASVLIDEDSLDWSQVPAKWEPYCRAYERLAAETRIKPIRAEFRMWSPEYWYAGCLDRVFFRGGRRGIADIGTGSVRHKEMQIAGYWKLWERWFPNERIEFGEIWKLNDDGTYRITSIDLGTGWQDFAAALRVAARRKEP